VLIGELVETTKAVGLATSLPSVFSEFAAEAVGILNQPSHPVYAKLNKYLQKGPCWNVAKFVPYWIENILLCEPEADDGHHVETTWLLSVLIRGLRDNQVWSTLIEGALGS
jgi:nucleolar pre-ribosomal-associated protein 1